MRMITRVEIKFAKLKDDAVIPSKRDEDAGFDIYACFDEEDIVIKPHETKKINTGIISAFSPGYVVILMERGSTGTRGMGRRAGVIDSGYRGEWIVPITNHNDVPLVITKDKTTERWHDDIERGKVIVYPASKAICQGLLLQSPYLQINACSVEEVCSVQSERGTGKLGSSGK